MNAQLESLEALKTKIEKSIEAVQQMGIDRINEVAISASKQAEDTLKLMTNSIKENSTQTEDILNKSKKTNAEIVEKTEKDVAKTKT